MNGIIDAQRSIGPATTDPALAAIISSLQFLP